MIKKKYQNEEKMREPESFWNQVEVKEKKREERMRSFWKVEVKKKKKERMWTMVYVCGGKKRKNVWMKKRQRIRNHNLKILPQYFYNKF